MLINKCYISYNESFFLAFFLIIFYITIFLFINKNIKFYCFIKALKIFILFVFVIKINEFLNNEFLNNAIIKKTYFLYFIYKICTLNNIFYAILNNIFLVFKNILLFESLYSKYFYYIVELNNLTDFNIKYISKNANLFF